MIDFTEEEFRLAAKRLGMAIRDLSEKTAADVGFSWLATEHAPNTFDHLVEAWDRSIRTGNPLLISDLNSDDVVFESPIDNIYLRFLHDSRHMQASLTFETHDEVEVAAIHIEEFGELLDHDSLEFEILRADTMGQAVMLHQEHRFAFDQRAFAQDVIRCGISEAIARDIDRARRAIGEAS